MNIHTNTTRKEKKLPLEFAKSKGWIPLLETAEEREEEEMVGNAESYTDSCEGK